VEAAEFAPPAGRFIVGYADYAPVAMGGLRRHADGEVEIKRMYVAPDVRGHGYARAILAALEERARELGATRVVLETGERQPEAIRLYESSGYLPIDGFGHYKCMPLSRSYAKQL
jgi:GNAT superfamily N-acetyltransferase